MCGVCMWQVWRPEVTGGEEGVLQRIRPATQERGEGRGPCQVITPPCPHPTHPYHPHSTHRIIPAVSYPWCHTRCIIPFHTQCVTPNPYGILPNDTRTVLHCNCRGTRISGQPVSCFLLRLVSCVSIVYISLSIVYVSFRFSLHLRKKLKCTHHIAVQIDISQNRTVGTRTLTAEDVVNEVFAS